MIMSPLCLITYRTSWHGVRSHHRNIQDTDLRIRELSIVPIMTLRLLALFLFVAQYTATSQPTRRDASPRRITFGIFAPGAAAAETRGASGLRGVTLGIEEARLTARLFGWDVVVVKNPDSLGGDDAIRFLAAAGVTAIVGDLTGILPRKGTLPGFSGLPNVPLLIDIAARRPADECDDREFHVLPLLDSTQWMASGSREPFARYASLVAWDSSLERFGAAQLNERYQRRFGTAMDERAWAGWMAVKAVLDAVMRSETSEPCALERFLVGARARFDGHKGVQLFFDPRSHELVQPLYVRGGVGEAEAVDVAMTGRAGNGGATNGTTCAGPCT